uniref:SFRICE_031105 n=1 Tax=Spodoptera frugiperda TaxID=7108 RepID=A0A2H1VAW6_SPOFR
MEKYYHVIPLAKNKSVIMYNSYTYSYHMKGKSLLRCSQKVSEKCRAFIKLDKHGNIMRAVTDHTHLPPICEMTDECELATLNGRKVFVYQGYTFSQHGPSPRNRYCSKKQSLKCPASLVVDPSGYVAAFKNCHNHPPPQIIRVKPGIYISCDLQYEVITLNGKSIILYQNHTFSKQGPSFRYQSCSKRARKNCPAKLILNADGEYNVIENYKNKVILYQGFTYAQRGSSCLNYYCSQKDSKHCRAKLKLTKEGALQWVYDDHSHPKPIVHRSKDGKYYKY